MNDIKPIFVSRMPNRKISGEAHGETIYSLKQDSGIVTVKKPLSSISKDEIETLLHNEKCKKLYESDKDLYDRIYARMAEYNFKAEKAFSPDYTIRKHSKNGEGPIIKSIKVPKVMSSGAGVKINNETGIAANGNMVRVDVFTKDSKYYLVPIYVADMVKDRLPNKAIRQGKSESEWLEMDENYTFKFSLYSNDMIAVKKKNEETIYGYYTSTHRGTGAINMISHDGTRKLEGIGPQNLEIFDKYEVDILGNYHKINKEQRKGGKKQFK